jgi:hypothetical protein
MSWAASRRRDRSKTATSKRIVAVHDFLVEVGFVAWVRKLPGFIFDGFHKAKDPADAASKRMIFWMKSLGIHAAQTDVFHAQAHHKRLAAALFR